MLPPDIRCRISRQEKALSRYTPHIRPAALKNGGCRTTERANTAVNGTRYSPISRAA